MKILTKHTYDKELASKIYNKLIKFNNKKQKTIQLKKWNKRIEQTLQQRRCMAHKYALKKRCSGFPGSTVVENLPANAGDMGSSPGLGRSHMPRSN